MNTKAVLSGRIAFLSLPELLQLLGSNGSTGRLSITSPATADSARVYFQNGSPINASTGALTGLEALQSLFGWAVGDFEFCQEEVTAERTINRNIMEIILDGLRMLDDGQIGQRDAGPPPTSADRDAAEEPPLIKKPVVHFFNIAGEERFPQGAKITEEGRFGNWMWIVLRGEAELQMETLRGPVSILRIGEGGCVGSPSAILAKGAKRSATVVAATKEVNLGVLDPQPLHAEYAVLSREFRLLILSLDNRMRAVCRNVAEIYGGKTGLMQDPGGWQPIVPEGTRDDRAFQIVQGEVLIARRDTGGWVPLARLGGEDLFGAIPFFSMGHEPQSAGVFASPDLRVKPLDTEPLEAEYAQLSPSMRGILDFSMTAISIATMKAAALCQEGARP